MHRTDKRDVPTSVLRLIEVRREPRTTGGVDGRPVVGRDDSIQEGEPHAGLPHPSRKIPIPRLTGEASI